MAKREYPAHYRDADVEILERLAVIETTIKLHPSCDKLKSLIKTVWGGMVFITVTLIGIVAKGIH